MAFLGVDQSLRGTGVCLIASDGALIELRTLKPKVQGDARLLWIKEQISPLLAGVIFAAHEAYSYDSTNRAFALGEVGGTVKVLLLEHSVNYASIPPALVKMFATGVAHADKSLMVEAAAAMGAKPGDDNQADAFHLARFARALSLGDAKKRQEMEAVHRFRVSVSGKPDKPVRRARRLVKSAI